MPKGLEVTVSFRFTDVAPGEVAGLLQEMAKLAEQHHATIDPETRRILASLPVRITRSREDVLAVMTEAEWNVEKAADMLGITKPQVYSLLADKGISMRKKG